MLSLGRSKHSCDFLRIICHDVRMSCHVSGEAEDPAEEEGRRGRGGDGQRQSRGDDMKIILMGHSERGKN